MRNGKPCGLHVEFQRGIQSNITQAWSGTTANNLHAKKVVSREEFSLKLNFIQKHIFTLYSFHWEFIKLDMNKYIKKCLQEQEKLHPVFVPNFICKFIHYQRALN